MTLYKKSARTASLSDPSRQYPILSLHWGDLHPAETVADLRFRRQVERIHALGPRVIAELLAELGAERSIMTLIDQKVSTYTELDPKVLTAASGDRFPPAPIYEVQR